MKNGGSSKAQATMGVEEEEREKRKK